MEKLELRTLEESDEKAYSDYVREFLDAGEDLTPLNSYRLGATFKEFLKRTREISRGQNLGEEWVPSTIYFLFRKGESKIIGAMDIRNQLNENLLKNGGNIGYGIAPSERKKGYATKMLQMGLDICKKMRMKKVLVTCKKKNIVSAKVIKKNGGVLENELTESDGIIRQRYWINLN